MAVGAVTPPETVMRDAAPDGPRKEYRTMVQLGQAAEQLLEYIKQHPMMNCDQFVIGFIESVREIAQRGDTTPALSRVEEALRQIQQNTTNGFKQIQKDTEDIRQRVLTIEKQAPINTAPTATNSSSFWRTHYATSCDDLGQAW
ncbi:hypothetical protein BDV29DRAFT_163902 [Aspergillus leporis]|jgi:hypothetical protein|uniref:Uncharacterized protein n=1 Tax=Aspergillus leporis TaxID=41062 RepID=A0A5N5WIH0_9EURO|nr:hypothetical protein BDV29DRAFT_163902 [Aspergillus leporis]